MVSEPMIHTCGSCTLCCKLLAVKELNKPMNKWCEFCTPGKCCNIYPNRPQSCVDFECGWLLSNLPNEFKPENLHIIITGVSDEIGATILHIDPAYPNAINTRVGQKLLQIFENNNVSVILVIGNKRKIISHSAKDAQRVQEIMQKIEKEEKI